MARYQDLYAQMAGMAPAPDIQRMRAQAQALRQTPSPQGQMISGRFAAPHWTQNLASTGSRILGSYMASQADEQQQEYMSELSQALRGTDNPQYVMDPGYQPPSMEQRLSDIADENPYAQQIMMQQAMQAPEEQWKTLAKEDADELGLPDGVWQISPEGQIKPAYEAEQPDYNQMIIQGPDGQPQINPLYVEGKERIAQAGSPSVNVNTGDTGPQIGTIPQGFQVTQSEDGSYRMEPIPGGPAEQEQQKAAEQAEMKQNQAERYADVVDADIDRALDIVENSDIPVTGFGSYLSAIPGTPARDLLGLVDTIRANVGFDRLQQMRNASPTGGALGQVSELENRLLQATLGNLELSQSEEQFKRNLKRVKDIYKQIIHEGIPEEKAQERIQDVVQDRPGVDDQTQGQTSVARPTTEAEYNALPSGALFIDPDDGKTYRKP